MKRVLNSIALLALTAAAVGAQVQPKRFSVTTRVGTITPERSASMDVGGVVGLDTEYSFNKYVALGTSLDVSRSNTHGEDFIARLRYGNPATGGGDTVYYQYLSQPVNTFNLGLYGSARYPMGKLAPFVMGGVGNYTMLLDTQVAGKAARRNNMSFTFGAGAWYALNERTGIQLDVRSLTMQKYDRKFLDPSSGKSPNNVFPEDFPAIPSAKNTAQNTVITLGFRYIPGAPGGN
jgi:outer membrane protein W